MKLHPAIAELMFYDQTVWHAISAVDDVFDALAHVRQSGHVLRANVQTSAAALVCWT